MSTDLRSSLVMIFHWGWIFICETSHRIWYTSSN